MTDHHAEGGTPCVISGWGYVTEALLFDSQFPIFVIRSILGRTDI